MTPLFRGKRKAEESGQTPVLLSLAVAVGGVADVVPALLPIRNDNP